MVNCFSLIFEDIRMESKSLFKAKISLFYITIHDGIIERSEHIKRHIKMTANRFDSKFKNVLAKIKLFFKAKLDLFHQARKIIKLWLKRIFRLW